MQDSFKLSTSISVTVWLAPFYHRLLRAIVTTNVLEFQTQNLVDVSDLTWLIRIVLGVWTGRGCYFHIIFCAIVRNHRPLNAHAERNLVLIFKMAGVENTIY